MGRKVVGMVVIFCSRKCQGRKYFVVMRIPIAIVDSWSPNREIFCPTYVGALEGSGKA